LLTVQEELFEAKAYIERQQHEIERLQLENAWLYGKLNLINDVLEEARNEIK
jgi:hypothetical protein